MSKTVQEFRIEQRFRRRLVFFAVALSFVFFAFTLQLVSLQLVHGYTNKILAKKFVSHQELTVAPRGLFFDRNFKLSDEPLVQNLRFIDFVIHPDRFKDRAEVIGYVKTFCEILDLDYDSTYASYFTPKRWKQIVRKNETITLLKRMTRREHERLAAFHIAMDKGEYVTQHLRYYAMGQALAHVSGYIGMPSSSEIRKKLARPYQTIGKAGLEAHYNNHLRGRDGVRVRHRVIDHEEQIRTTQQGENLILTIDRNIQAVAYRALVKASHRGTVIVMRADNGEVLALVSHPSFDPNILSSGSVEQRRKHLREVHLHNGFLNLAIQAKFPPASTFKPLVSLAALESTDPNFSFSMDTSFYCPGSFSLKSSLPGRKDATFNCLRRHGRNSMLSAMAHSCNVYFYHLGYELGPKSIIDFARAFGLDKKTEIDLPGEIEGHVPDERWKQLKFSSRWYDGDTINLSIGQGFLQNTPLQIAVLFSALVNRGKIYRPYLVKEIRNPIDNRLIKQNKPELLREIPLSLTSVNAIHSSLRRVVTKGTAYKLSRLSFPVAGKTGTVQTRSKKKSKDHAWFASFAPYGADVKDIIVVVVFLEHGLAGSASAVPVTAEIYKTIFSTWKKNKK